MAVEFGVLTDVRIGREQIFLAVVVEIVRTDSPAAHGERPNAEFGLVCRGTKKAVTLIPEQREHVSS